MRLKYRILAFKQRMTIKIGDKLLERKEYKKNNPDDYDWLDLLEVFEFVKKFERRMIFQRNLLRSDRQTSIMSIVYETYKEFFDF